MIKLTPTQRLEWLLEQPYLGDAHSTIVELLSQYEEFLDVTNADEDELLRRFLNKDESRKFMDAAYKFGDLIFESLTRIGRGNQFHRLLVV